MGEDLSERESHAQLEPGIETRDVRATTNEGNATIRYHAATLEDIKQSHGALADIQESFSSESPTRLNGVFVFVPDQPTLLVWSHDDGALNRDFLDQMVPPEHHRAYLNTNMEKTSDDTLQRHIGISAYGHDMQRALDLVFFVDSLASGHVQLDLELLYDAEARESIFRGSRRPSSPPAPPES